MSLKHIGLKEVRCTLCVPPCAVKLSLLSSAQHFMSRSCSNIVWWRDATWSSNLIKKDRLSHICWRLGKFNKTLFFLCIWEREAGQCSQVCSCVYSVSCSFIWNYLIVSFVCFSTSPSAPVTTRRGFRAELFIYDHDLHEKKKLAAGSSLASSVLPDFCVLPLAFRFFTAPLARSVRPSTRSMTAPCSLNDKTSAWTSPDVTRDWTS